MQLFSWIMASHWLKTYREVIKKPSSRLQFFNVHDHRWAERVWTESLGLFGTSLSTSLSRPRVPMGGPSWCWQCMDQICWVMTWCEDMVVSTLLSPLVLTPPTLPCLSRSQPRVSRPSLVGCWVRIMTRTRLSRVISISITIIQAGFPPVVVPSALILTLNWNILNVVK